MLAAVVVGFIIVAGLGWFVYEAWAAPELCWHCGGNVSLDVANDRERCSHCGVQFD